MTQSASVIINILDWICYQQENR